MENEIVGNGVLYGIRIIEPRMEGEQFSAAVMYSSGSHEGPWHDMVTGHYEWCEEVLEALLHMRTHSE